MRLRKKTIERLIREEAEKELCSSSDDEVSAYSSAAVSFMEERLCYYSLSYMDRFLMAASRGIDPEILASAELSLAWYDCRGEKEAVDKSIEAGLNLNRPVEEIADGLIEDFGAFPDSSIIKEYRANPLKNRVPDYILAVALEKAREYNV